MKKLILLILFPILSRADHLTSYDLLENFYVDGATPTFEEVTGWWSGRCFHKDEPNKALPFMLIAAETSPGERHLAIASHLESDDPQNRYDNVSDIDRAMFLHFMRSDEFLASEISSRDNTLYSNIDLGVQATKKFGGYYVSILRHSTNADYNYNCFFFKKVM